MTFSSDGGHFHLELTPPKEKDPIPVLPHRGSIEIRGRVHSRYVGWENMTRQHTDSLHVSLFCMTSGALISC